MDYVSPYLLRSSYQFSQPYENNPDLLAQDTRLSVFERRRMLDRMEAEAKLQLIRYENKPQSFSFKSSLRIIEEARRARRKLYTTS